MRNRLGLSALLRADARFGALRIDKCNQRDREAIGEFVNASRLAVALRMRFAEVAREPLGGGMAPLMAHDRGGAAAELRQAGDDRAVVSVAAIAMNLEEIAE